MIRGSLIVWAAALFSTTILYAQTPTITSVTNESGSTSLCPGGIAFANGTNLGTNASSVVLTVGNKQGYVFNAFNTTLQFEIPVDVPLGATTLKVGSSAPFN